MELGEGTPLFCIGIVSPLPCPQHEQELQLKGCLGQTQLYRPSQLALHTANLQRAEGDRDREDRTPQIHFQLLGTRRLHAKTLVQ